MADLSPLAALPNLRVLNLDGTPADLSEVARLAALRTLSLRAAGLDDAGALRGLSELRVLDLGDNRLGDLAPLAALRSLEALRADGNGPPAGAGVADLERLLGRNLDGRSR